jgi:hypothetical protein
MTTEPTAPPEPGPLRFLARAAVLFVTAVAVAATGFGQVHFAIGVLAGGALALANLFWLRRHLAQVLRLEGAKAGLLAQLKLATRLGMTALLLYLLLVPLNVNVAGLLTGLSALFVAVIAYLLTILTRRGKDP